MDGAWAGGRGFKKQPYLTLADAGGGVVTGDSVTMVSASITPSLTVMAPRPASEIAARRGVVLPEASSRRVGVGQAGRRLG